MVKQLDGDQVKTLLDMITKLEASSTSCDLIRLASIRSDLETKSEIYDSDRTYIESKFAALQQVSANDDVQDVEKISDATNATTSHTPDIRSHSLKQGNYTRRIVIATCIVISAMIIFTMVILNIYAVSNLEWRSSDMSSDGVDFSDFDAAEIQLVTTYEMCNPTFFPASFDELEIDIIYKDDADVFTITILGKTIPPMSATTTDGKINMSSDFVLTLFADVLGSMFEESEMEFDEKNFNLMASINAPIFGIIPWSTTYETDYVLRQTLDTAKWSC